MTEQTPFLPSDGPPVLAQVIRLATEHSLDMLPTALYQQHRNTALRAWAATWPGLPAADMRAQVRLLDIHHILTPRERANVFVLYYRLNGGAHRHGDRLTDGFSPDQYLRAMFPLDALDVLDQEWLHARKRRQPYYKYVRLPSPNLIRGLWWAAGGGVLLVLLGLILGARGDVAMVGGMLAVASGGMAWSYQRLVVEAAAVEAQYRAQRLLLEQRLQRGPSPAAGSANEPPAGDPG